MKKILIAIVFIVGGLTSFDFENSTTAESDMKVAREATDINSIRGDLDEGIEFFHGTWWEAIKKADKENKLIFLDAYAAWCGPCKMMARQTFTDKKVGEFFNKNFINFKMDMEKHAEGPRLSKKFKLRAYPTLFFIDENEKIVEQTLGFQDAKALLSFGADALL
jgi:thioredoxin